MDSFLDTVTAGGVVFTILTLFSTFGRFYCRKIKGARIGADDVIILVDNALLVTITVLFNYSNRTEPSDTNYRLILVTQLLTFLLLGSVKIAVLFFYKRIFENARFRLISNILIAVTVVWTVVYLTLLLRYPLFLKWHRDDPPAPISVPALIFTFFVWDVLLDIVVLSLPVPMISRLNLNRKRKILLTCVFLMGALATIASLIRLAYLGLGAVDARRSGPLGPASLSDGKNITIWTVLDGPFTVIAANLPVLGLPTDLKQRARAFLQRVSAVLTGRSCTRGQPRDEDLPPAEVIQHDVSGKAAQLSSIDGRKWRHMWQAINRDDEAEVSGTNHETAQMNVARKAPEV